MKLIASTCAAVVCIAVLQSSIVKASDGIHALVFPNGTIEVSRAIRTAESPPLDAFFVECDKLRLAPNGTAEFEGNVTLRGERFKAQAGKAMLTDDGRLRLQADVRNDAMLSFRKADEPSTTLRFSVIDYWPKNSRFRVGAVRPPVFRVPAARNSSSEASP